MSGLGLCTKTTSNPAGQDQLETYLSQEDVIWTFCQSVGLAEFLCY